MIDIEKYHEIEAKLLREEILALKTALENNGFDLSEAVTDEIVNDLSHKDCITFKRNLRDLARTVGGLRL